MKTRLIFLFMLVVCISCGTNNKPLSDAQKEKVISEVKVVVNNLTRDIEEAKFDSATASWLDSPDFTYINNGKVYTYKECMDFGKKAFNSLSNQKATFVSEKYAVLDRSTVIYTSNASWVVNFKDGHSVIQDPWINQLTFEKINGKWKVAALIESGFEEVDQVSKTPKELNQGELAKQFLGNWKCESNDTVFVYDQKPYGTVGQEVLYKITTKGKLVGEGRQLLGYDKKQDKIILTSVAKNGDVWVGSLVFNSKNKYSFVWNGAMYHPESAIYRGEGEIVSPDKYVEKILKGDQTIQTFTYTKAK